MNATQKPLDGVPEINCIYDCHLLHAEVLDSATGQAWHSVDPITRADYEALEVPEGFLKVGINSAVADLHYFRRPPNADTDGPLEEGLIGGRRFIQNANAPSEPPRRLGGKYPLMILANKYHSLVYNGGRHVRVLTAPDGTEYVELIAVATDGGSLYQDGRTLGDPDDLGLPEGWTVREQAVKERTVIHLPCPAQALFFANGASFQGPVDAFRDGTS